MATKAKRHEPIKGQTLYARDPKPLHTHRIIVLRVNKHSVRIQHLKDDGSPIEDGYCLHPASHFIETLSLDEWYRIRPHWRLTPPQWRMR